MPKSTSTDAKLTPIRLGVSACLLGQELRYDGGHSHDGYVAGILAAHCELVPVCPESELGMGVPRETIDLVGEVDRPRLVATHTRKDWTGPMSRWSGRRARELASLDLCGYIFKSKSPSCGVYRVKVHPEQGRVRRQGRGLFAAEFARRFPLIPLTEEELLQSPAVRDDFIVRIFALQRLRAAFAGRWRLANITAFFGQETALLQAHNAKGCKQLGAFLATASTMPRHVFRAEFQAAFMAILARPATVLRNARALRRLIKLLPPAARQTARGHCDNYQRGLLPLLAPATILRHLGQAHAVPELLVTSFLNADPREMALRNHA